jgi:hypothetical protein
MLPKKSDIYPAKVFTGTDRLNQTQKRLQKSSSHAW